MKRNSTFRIAAAVPQVTPGNITHNLKEILSCCNEAHTRNCAVLLLPELSLTGAGCGDLFASSRFREEVITALQALKEWTTHAPLALITGFPLYNRGRIFNCAAVIQNGRIRGANCKYAVSDPLFTSGQTLGRTAVSFAGDTFICDPGNIFEFEEVRFALVTGDDLTAPGNYSGELRSAGAQVIFNPAALPELAAVSAARQEYLRLASSYLTSVIVTAGAGIGEPGADFICGGRAAIFNNGHTDAENTPLDFERSIIFADIIPERLDIRKNTKKENICFESRLNALYHSLDFLPGSPDWNELHLEKNPFVPEDKEELSRRCAEILRIQSAALARRVKAVAAKKLVIGLSGGLDSTWAFLICVECCKLLRLAPETICAVTMPGFGTSSRTKGNAEKMAELFGAELRIIPIAEAVTAHFNQIGHDPENHNVTYENSQARERTQILMDLANELSGIVIGTGDLSESALGWCTYNGDQMSMYGVNGSIPKTLMRHLVTFYADTAAPGEAALLLKDVVNTPVSPELLPGAQHTEELIGSYDLHDFFIWHTVHYGADGEFLQKAAEKVFENVFSPDEIASALQVFDRRFKGQQFKRNPMPDGAQAGTLSLSPRTDWHAPSDC